MRLTPCLTATALLAGTLAFSATEMETPQMEVGTNFWDIQWGGEKNQPFTTPYDQFVPSDHPWNPVFLQEIEIFSCLRFMDWNRTNSPEKEWAKGVHVHQGGWAGRVQRDDPVQRPMAYEWMIDLCNTVHRDLWITVPHVVDDDYVKHLAELIKAQLDPNLQCYVEWSNETWNGSFTQANYCNEKGQELPDEFFIGFHSSKKNTFYTGQLYHAVRTLQVHKIFLEVFEKSQRDRLVLVMGGSIAHAFYRDAHLFAIQNKRINPDKIIPDAYALAPYIGHGILPDDPDAFEKLAGPVLQERLSSVKKIGELMNANGIALARLSLFAD